MRVCVACDKFMRAPSFTPKQSLRALVPVIFRFSAFLFFFIVAAESRPLGVVENRVPVPEISKGMNALDIVRLARSNDQFAIRVLKVRSTIEEDFDDDDEDTCSACLGVCHLLLLTDLCEILIPKTRVQHLQLGIVLFLFERPPPSLIPDSPIA